MIKFYINKFKKCNTVSEVTSLYCQALTDRSIALKVSLLKEVQRCADKAYSRILKKNSNYFVNKGKE